MGAEIGRMELPEDMEAIYQQWIESSSQDRIAATLEKEEEFKLLEIIPIRTWPKIWKNCPFLVPEGAKHAKMINEVLVTSWETQASYCQSLPLEHNGIPMYWLLTQVCFKVHGWLAYYFKCLGKFIVYFRFTYFCEFTHFRN